jgi:hypothetical protein
MHASSTLLSYFLTDGGGNIWKYLEACGAVLMVHSFENNCKTYRTSILFGHDPAFS